jgi:hypothetical protein
MADLLEQSATTAKQYIPVSTQNHVKILPDFFIIIAQLLVIRLANSL